MIFDRLFSNGFRASFMMDISKEKTILKKSEEIKRTGLKRKRGFGQKNSAGSKSGMGKVQASVARCLRTPPHAARREGFWNRGSGCVALAASGSEGETRSFIAICNYTREPITVVSRRSKADPFKRLSILFQPHHIHTGFFSREVPLQNCPV